MKKIKSFKELFEQKIKERESKLSLFESLRDENITKGDLFCKNICEASLSRLWTRAQNQSFAIITAYRGEYSKEQNVQRNRSLRGELNSKKMGPHSLIGHWQECSLKDSKGQPVDYDKCPRDKLVSVVERSYFVTPPMQMSDEEFRKIILELGRKYNQDGVVLKADSLKMYGVYNPRNGAEFVRFSKGVGMNRIAQAYSKHVKKQNVPFIFEGVEVPQGLSLTKSAFRDNGFYW
jgi:hypothetical protein